ncbi:PucR family transcriptional regulator [Nocardia thailandica]
MTTPFAPTPLTDPAPRRARPDTGAVDAVTALTRICTELARRTLDGDTVAPTMARLEHTTGACARDGIPIDTVLHAVHQGCRSGMSTTRTSSLAAHHDPVRTGERLIQLLDLMTTTVGTTYVRERTLGTAGDTAAPALAAALLAGHAGSPTAREHGHTFADAYHVLAVTFPPHRDETAPGIEGIKAARAKLGRIQAVLSVHDEPVPAQLSVTGGTVLVPGTARDTDVDILVSRMSERSGVAVTAAVVSAELDRVPDAARRAHDLLDIVDRLDGPARVYRFDELALEYQLTRPGTARDQLGALLTPLDEHPELLHTLRVHIGTDLNRQQTARLLHIHTNTVDYRLRRIGRLTRLDPSHAAGLWQLRSALIAYSYRSAATASV